MGRSEGNCLSGIFDLDSNELDHREVASLWKTIRGRDVMIESTLGRERRMIELRALQAYNKLCDAFQKLKSNFRHKRAFFAN